MKRTYMIPSVEVMNIQTEGMIAGSMKISGSKSGNQQLSKEKNSFENPIWKD